MRAGRALGLLLMVNALSACSPHKISYPLDDVPRLPGGPLSQLSVVVEPLEDGRSASGRPSTDVIEQGGQERETVTDEAYEGHSIPLAVTNALADHVRVTEMFRSVEVGGSTTPADLHLTGRLRSFGAVRDYQPGTRAFLAAGGLVPLLVAANTDTNYDADVRIDNIRLFRPSTGAVLWKGEVTGTISGKTTVAASDRVNVEDYANVAVKDAVNKLLTQLSQLHIADVTALTNTPAGAGNAQ